MTTGVRYKLGLGGVDWGVLKEELAADDFDNGRTPDELRRAFENSYAAVIAWQGDRVVGTARLLADGVCNAYLVDVWTSSLVRRRAIGTTMVKMLLDTVSGHHVCLFTEEHVPFYESLGFQEERTGMSTVVGDWLNRPES